MRPRSEPKQLPIYDTMEQCASATGIPKTLISEARRQGCIAFSSNRVRLDELLKWIFSRNDGEIEEDWGRALKKEQTLVTRARRMEITGKIADKDETVRGLQAIESIMFGELDQVFGFEFPAAAKGMDETQIRAKCLEHIERLKTKLRDKFEAAKGKSKEVELG